MNLVFTLALRWRAAHSATENPAVAVFNPMQETPVWDSNSFCGRLHSQSVL